MNPETTPPQPKLRSDLKTLLDRIVEAADHRDKKTVRTWFENVKHLSFDEQGVFLDALLEIRDKGASETLDALWELDYRVRPVTIEQFLDDDYYFGHVGRTLYPAWRSDLIYVCSAGSPVAEWVLTGAIGAGKTYSALVAQAFKVYLLSCLRSPQAYYGLAPGTEIAFGCFNVTLRNAASIDFIQMRRFFDSSPYFKEQFGRRKSKDTRIEWPQANLFIQEGSTEIHALGSNLFSVVIDEMNFMRKLRNLPKGEDAKERDQAYQLYNHTSRRIKSRFAQHGWCPGLACLVSSRRTQSSFLEEHLRMMRGSSELHVSDYSLWDTKGRDRYSDRSFRVAVGNRYRSSKLLDRYDLRSGDLIESFDPPEEQPIVEVPMDFYADFHRDIEGALRDVAGIPTFGESPLIQRPESVYACIDKSRKHPFSVEQATLPLNDPAADLLQLIDWEQLVYIDKSAARMKLRPSEPRVIHVDLGLTGDSAGMAMGHRFDYYTYTKHDPITGMVVEEFRPKIWMDFMLRIVPTFGTQIDLTKIVAFILNLRNFGIPLIKVTFDGWESAMASQILQKAAQVPTDSRRQQHRKDPLADIGGFKGAGILSVDRDDRPYAMLRDTMTYQALNFYYYKPYIDEVVRLVHDVEKRKVDHPPDGCFVGDTRLPLLDGTFPTIAEVCDREVWVYSAKTDGNVVPGLARGRKTKEVTELVDVILDTGAVVRCTPEHRFLLRNGTYREAQQLRPVHDRLMPFTRQWPVNGGYERLSIPSRGRVLTHHMVVGGKIPKGCIVHHVNGQKRDNRPENLRVERKSAHSRAHTTIRHRSDERYAAKVRAGLQRFNESKVGRRKHSAAMKRTNQRYKKGSLAAAERTARRGFYRSDITLSALCELKYEVANANQASKRLRCGRNVVMRVLRQNGFETWDAFQKSTADGPGNHRVQAVIPVHLSEPVPVYDLEVDGWSNFGLMAGVIVHNSKDVSDAVAGTVYGLSTLDLPIRTVEPDRIFEGADPAPATIEEQGLHDIVGAALRREHIEGIDPSPMGKPAMPVKPKPGRSLSSGQADIILQMARWGRGGE